MSGDLFTTIRRGNFIEVIRLVTHGADVNASNKYGDTVLHLAAGKGHAAIVEYLVIQGANVNKSNNVDSTPLYWAARNGHAAIVRFLVSHGAEVNAREKNGAHHFTGRELMVISRLLNSWLARAPM